MDKVNVEKASSTKCYNCGKNFKTAQHLTRHKQRKTPCLIREITEDQRKNPNRCIFCNKIFSNISNLHKHLRICKIKNGGINILDEKTRYEEKIRTLEEQLERMDDLREQDKKRMDDLEGQVNEMKKQMMAAPINITVTNNFHFHNYDNPKIDTFKLTQEKLLSESTMIYRLLELIYFNVDIPENHVLYQPNAAEARLLVHKDGLWKTFVGANLTYLSEELTKILRVIGAEKMSADLNQAELWGTVRTMINDFKYERLTPEKIVACAHLYRIMIDETRKLIK